MTDVRPFRGLRYDPAIVGDWGTVLGPPYDVMSAAERTTLFAASPYQITRVEALPAEEVQKAASRLSDWRREGALRQEAQPVFYLAEHRFRHEAEEYTRLCLFAVVRLTPWEAGDVLAHEWTMAGPRRDRALLRATTRCDISPLMALAPDADGRLLELLRQAQASDPVLAGDDANGEHHALHLIEDGATIEALRQTFAASQLYIADGHHRYEAALEQRDQQATAAGEAWGAEAAENFVLMGIVSAKDPGLLVGATHRLVHVTSPADALAQLDDRFVVQALGSRSLPARALLGAMATAGGLAIGAIGLDAEQAHLLIAHDGTRRWLPAETPPSWAGLDAALLQHAALGPVFGIDEAGLRGGEAVSYTHDAEAALAAVAEGAANVAFLLNPPTLAQIFQAADGGDRMPQKSTCFTPKLPTGVVLHAFD